METTCYGTLETETRIRPEDVEEQFRYGDVVELHMGKNSYDSTIPTFKPHSKRLGEEKLTMYKVGDFVYVLASLFGLKRFLPKEVRHLKKGVYHNEHGPAEDDGTGYKAWYQHGQLHRDDSPAEEQEGQYKAWYQRNELHRLDGPAVERADGTQEWWVEGFQAKHPTICQQAYRATTIPEKLLRLCTHNDYVVRTPAAHNPNCPDVGKVLVALKNATTKGA